MARRRWAVLAAAAGAAYLGLLAVGDAINLAWRPPQPIPWGARMSTYETNFTVANVERRTALKIGGTAVRANGEFYLIDVIVECPFGLRYPWSDDDVIVHTFAGPVGTPVQTFAIDRPVQALLDAADGRNPVPHQIPGASEHERLVYDLPRDVRQPGLLWRPMLEPGALIDALLGLRVVDPRRFNLRYD